MSASPVVPILGDSEGCFFKFRFLFACLFALILFYVHWHFACRCESLILESQTIGSCHVDAGN